MSKGKGTLFQEDIESSCKSSKPEIFFDRIKDVYIPPNMRHRVPVVKNKYDCYFFERGHLFAIELKSTKGKSVSFAENIIRPHQIENLKWAATFDRVVAGFIFNFRESANKTYFVHIDDFLRYKGSAENGLSYMYKSKINKSSIPIGICEEIGIEISNKIMRVRYRYDIRKFIDEAILKYRRV